MTKSSLSIPRPPGKAGLRGSVSPEQVAGVDLLLYIIEAAIIAVGNDGLTPLFERLKVVYHLAAKEGRAVLQRRLVDDDGRALGLDPLHDALNAAGVEIVIQRFGLPQKLRAEDDVPALIFFPDRSREANRDGGLDDHDGLGVHLHHQLDDRLHRRGIEEVLPAVVVGRGGNDHEVRVPVGRFPVQRSGQVEILFRKVSFNVVILNGRLFVVDLLHLLRHDVHSGDMVVLAQQSGDGQADIAP